MNIHNQMEDLVTEFVTDIFDEEKTTKQRTFCVCSQCELDVSCYVLNRIEPRYLTSERGAAHTEGPYLEKIQENADIATLIHEGIERVSSTKRPNFSHRADDDFHPREGAVYNLPMIKGRFFDGGNFEPVGSIDVYLRADSHMVDMVDPNWQNPCHTYCSGQGSFFFLPAPARAEGPGKEKVFQFEIVVDDDRFEALHHFFSITAVSDERFRYELHPSESFSCEDLYLFPRT